VNDFNVTPRYYLSKFTLTSFEDQIKFIKQAILLTVFSVAITGAMPAKAGVIQINDLNQIDDNTNPSDDLRYLDMTFSDGLSLTAAINNAQAKYADTRLATHQEFEDLFQAFGIAYSGDFSVFGFSSGGSGTFTIDSDVITLVNVLGPTTTGKVNIWTAPDASFLDTSTIDYVEFRQSGTDGKVHQFGSSPPHSSIGWLLVTDSGIETTQAPEPTTLVLLGLGLAGIGFCRRKAS
jgi:hypothetical protein